MSSYSCSIVSQYVFQTLRKRRIMKKRNETVRTNAAHAQSQQKVNRLAAMAAILGL